jgi:hypothetical protein
VLNEQVGQPHLELCQLGQLETRAGAGSGMFSRRGSWVGPACLLAAQARLPAVPVCRHRTCFMSCCVTTWQPRAKGGSSITLCSLQEHLPREQAGENARHAGQRRRQVAAGERQRRRFTILWGARPRPLLSRRLRHWGCDTAS